MRNGRCAPRGLDDLQPDRAPAGLCVDPLELEGEARLRAALERHLARTGSALAAEVLDDWSHGCREFRCVRARTRASIERLTRRSA